MKVGQMFVWFDSRFKFMHALGYVNMVRDDGKVVVNITWPEDEGELREMHPISSYITRSNTVLHSKTPGKRTLEARHRMLREIWSN